MNAHDSEVSATAARSLWRWFPYYVAVGLGLVVLVNGGMVYTALRTFPGIAADGVFDRSNGYDQVLDDAKRQAALGWTVESGIDAGRPVVTMSDRAGRPINGLRIAGTARRPLGREAAVVIAFRATAPGRYVADRTLEARGQWELRLDAASGQQSFRATRRIVVP